MGTLLEGSGTVEWGKEIKGIEFSRFLHLSKKGPSWAGRTPRVILGDFHEWEFFINVDKAWASYD